MMELLDFVIKIITKCHDKIMSFNDGFESSLNDKQLHFIMIGALGIGLFFVTHALFKWLSGRSITAISFIYTLTVVLVITFAIEIGQKVSGTGSMEFRDITAGIWGFIAAFAVYIIAAVVLRIMSKNKKIRKSNKL